MSPVLRFFTIVRIKNGHFATKLSVQPDQVCLVLEPNLGISEFADLELKIFQLVEWGIQLVDLVVNGLNNSSKIDDNRLNFNVFDLGRHLHDFKLVN